MSDQISELPHLLTLTNTARVFGVRRLRVRKWIDDGDLPFITLPSGRRKIRRVDIEPFLTPRRATDTN